MTVSSGAAELLEQLAEADLADPDQSMVAFFLGSLTVLVRHDPGMPVSEAVTRSATATFQFFNLLRDGGV